MQSREGKKVVKRRASAPASLVPNSINRSLREHTFFSGLDDSTLEEIVLGLQVHRVGPGDVLIQQGNTGRALFLVLSGSVTVWSETQETTLARLHRGSFFGEIGALYDVPRTATVRAQTISSIAILSRDALLEILKDRPETLRKIINEAQKRYRETRPRPIPNGHMGDLHYQMTALRSRFPLFSQYPDDYLMQFLLLSIYRIEHSRTIIAFAQSNGEVKSDIFLVLSGTLQAVSSMSSSSIENFQAGMIASIQADGPYNLLTYLVTSTECTFIQVSKSIYDMAMSGVELPLEVEEGPIEKGSSISPSSTPPPSLISSIEKNLGGAVLCRRAHSVATVFWHEQQTPLLHHQPPASTTLIDDQSSNPLKQITRLNLEDTPVAVALLTLLDSLGIHVEDPTSLMPGGDGHHINLIGIRREARTRVVTAIVTLIGKRLETLNLAGANVTDEALLSMAQYSENLANLVIPDCYLATTEGFISVITGCRRLSSLCVANCPGFTDRCLHALNLCGNQVTELDISYCRNISEDGWKLIVGFSTILEKLVMRRLISLNEEAINSAGHYLPFGHLRILDLSECAFLTSGGLRDILAKTPVLEKLGLAFCTGLDETVTKAFAQLEDAPMIALDVAFCVRAINDRTIASLSGSMPGLERLCIRGARSLSENSLKSLLNLQKLTHLNVSDCTELTDLLSSKVAATKGWKLLGATDSII